jgi:alkaline phosphatase D
VDFVFCYGDYIYEGRSQRMRSVSGWPVVSVRQHPGQELYSLEDYRQRYAIYKMDPDLQGAHATAAWFPVWDDHEIDNNWVADLDQDGTPPEVFRLRKQAAMQAFYENMPLRSTSFPNGPSMSLYRRASFGNLLDMSFLDTRQYRTDQPCDDRWRVECADLRNPEADVLGAAQEAWLMEGLTSSRARWKALAQQVMMMDLDREPGETYAANLDTWGGYRAPRERFLRALTDRRIKDTVILTGDEHQNYAGNVHLDGQNPGKTPITSEFVATSISSGGDGADMRPDMPEVVAVNPELKFNNAQRGYLVCEVTPALWKTHFRVIDQISTPGGSVSTRATYALEHGKQGLVEA